MTIVPVIKRDYITKLAEQGKRIDGRNFDQYRNIEIETKVVNKAEGSARVKIGNTQVLVGIKIDLGEPFAGSPNMGVLSTAAELILSQVHLEKTLSSLPELSTEVFENPRLWMSKN
jgi:exosome complex component RRP42